MPWVFARALVWALGPGAPPGGAPQVPEAPPPGAVAELHWSAPEGCPLASDVEAMVLRRLGEDSARPQLWVDATVTAEGEGFVLDLRLRQADQDDQRRIEAARCGSLGRATALIVALALDPVAVARTLAAVPVAEAPPDPEQIPAPPAEAPPAPSLPPASPTPTPASSPPPATAPAAPPNADESRPRPPPTMRIAAEGGLERGAVPGFAGLAGLAAVLTWPTVRLELAGLVVTPRPQQIAEAGARVMLGAVALRACLRLRPPRVEIPLCGGLEGGAMRGDGRRAPDARTAHGPWVAAVLGPGLRVPWGDRFAIYGRIDAVVAPIRSGFQVSGLGGTEAIFESAPVSGRVLLGIDVKIAGPGDENPVRRRSEDG